MSPADSTMASPDILMIGPFPPPVHGQAVATKAMADMLESEGLRIERCDTGEGASGGRLSRIKRLAKAMQRIASTPASHIYISANANKGMAITALMCRAAKARGKVLSVHHHAYSYIGKHSPLAERMARASGRDTLHLVQCDRMGRELAGRYGPIQKTLPFSNIGFLQTTERRAAKPTQFNFGHMSNLTREKGLGEVIDTLRTALADGLDARLVVAGPESDDFARETIVGAQAEFGDRVDYRGPVYDADKHAFFGEIDLFLFPTRYRNETQGIVVLEALSHGVPVATVDQCCVGEAVDETCGIVVSRTETFARQALAFGHAVHRDREAVRSAALARFHLLTRRHEAERDAVIRHFKGVMAAEAA